MDNCRILITGDYWHQDFRDFVTSFNSSVMMVPQEQLANLDPAANFDLIILAESRRGQIERTLVQSVQQKFSTSPMVALLGSWCEGEERSGDPIAGVVRVYWHQWQGRYDEFLKTMADGKIANWLMPKTANRTDRIQEAVAPAKPKFMARSQGIIGISTRTRDTFEMLAEALKISNWKSFWIEQSSLPADRMPEFAAVCVEADSMTEEIENRVDRIKKAHPFVPIIGILNFPRVEHTFDAQNMGMQRIVSKPFQLVDLNHAVNSVVGSPVEQQR